MSHISPGFSHHHHRLRSGPLAGRKVMVDPGHGGSDPGAPGPGGGREADVNLGISLKLRDELEDLGAEVRMTRETDRNVSRPGAPQNEELRARVALANGWPADVFVAVHANSNSRAEPRGTETYHARNASSASRELAAEIHQEIVEATGFADRGVKSANYFVLANTRMPAVLVETGFISNPEEEQRLKDPEVQQNIAGAISRGVEAVFGNSEQFLIRKSFH